MPWIDGHLDLACLALEGRDLRAAEPDPAEGCVTLPALRQGGVEIALATIFTEPDPAPGDKPMAYPPHDPQRAEAVGRRQLEVYRDLEEAGEISFVRTRDDLHRPGPLPKLVLLMEGADPIRSPEHVETWAREGLRFVGLTWGRGTRYAGGNAAPGPLTEAGRGLVRALDAAGLVHDASHLADQALDELLTLAAGPIVATHSNCRALMDDDQRHLRDDQIGAIADRGGIIGLNLYGRFLAKGRRARIDDCVRHIEHVCGIAGHRRCVGLGSDMDGGFGPGDLPEGVDRPARLDAIADALAAAGWSDDDVEGFRYRNWFRFLEQVLP